MPMYQMHGLNDAEYAALKAAAKAEVPFPVTIRRHTKRYVWHQVDIRPTAQTQHRFTEAQVDVLRDFCTRHGLHDGLRAIQDKEHWHNCVFWQGFNYLARHTPVGMRSA